MVINAEYILREAGPDHWVMGAPDARGRRRMIRLNSSAAFLWRSVAGKPFTEADLAALLQAEYDVDAQTASADAHNVAREWLGAGLVLES